MTTCTNDTLGLSVHELETLVERYPWCSPLRIALARGRTAAGETDTKDAATELLRAIRPTSFILPKEVNIDNMTHLTSDDIIARFLKQESYRIAADNGTEEDLADIVIEADDDMVSEDLAEIYLKQGLYCEAIDTYRKLSLLNSEKSIYFARLIAEIEAKKDKN